MGIDFYTIDNLRQQLTPEGGAFKLTRHDTLEQAIAAYRALPDTKTRALGIRIDRKYELDLVQCRPVYPLDERGENLLVADYLKVPRFAENPQVCAVVERLCGALEIDNQLSKGRILDIVKGDRDLYLQDIFLKPKCADHLMNAVKEIYVVGYGWLDSEAYREHFSESGQSSPYFPYIEQYHVRYQKANGECGTMDITPQDFDALYAQTEQALQEGALKNEPEKRHSASER